jgi:hypothetical protein
MPKVTYLFGTGASCNCLPTVDEIPGCLDALFHLFTNNPFPAELILKKWRHLEKDIK